MPQVEVEEVDNPDLNAQIMAERLAYSLDRGRHYRRAGYYILRKVMDTGKAKGVEIVVSGKVTSQRARTQIFRAGTMKKSGHPAQEAVDKGVAQCIMKSGVLGVIVKIMRSDYRTGDGVYPKYKKLEAAQKAIDATKEKTKAEALMERKKAEAEKGASLVEEEAELIDEVDEEDITEISLEPEIEKAEEAAEEEKEEEKEE